MLWSIIPEDLVFAGFDSTEQGAALVDYELDNCPCRLRRLADGAFGLEALCSTNPKHFLQRNLQPGRRIFLSK